MLVEKKKTSATTKSTINGYDVNTVICVRFFTCFMDEVGSQSRDDKRALRSLQETFPFTGAHQNNKKERAIKEF